MQRPRASLVFFLPLAAVLVSACGTQFGNEKADRRYDDLRSLLLEQRRTIEDMKHEQESLRAAVDEMQYGRYGGRAAHGPGGAGGDSYWGGGAQRTTPPVPAPGTEGAPTGEGLLVLPPAPTEEDSRFAPPGPVVSVPSPKEAPSTPETAPPAPTGGGDTGQIPSDLAGTNYDSAMRALSAGDHDEAIQHFRDFLHDNPQSPYADDAQYWIGEAYYRKGQYHRAIIELNQVSITYGSGNRAPAALVRQAEAFRIVGDRVDAKLSLQKVINRYPGTAEAAKASKMLSEIGG